MQEENNRERQERDERSLGEHFAELSQKTTALVRQEIQLAKVEMSQKASRVGKNVGFLLVGASWPTRGCWRSWPRGSYCWGS
jgi:hypothetical protein